ncbi:hypothetical protein [Salinisphaera sp. Q1T1-3]|uniref:hypothetical protein n=1 Tax=Salinisphaera sp. Q1T1-3 TaxID=2321229 RepID=UPI000E70DEF7|nr:hypothetical protein [Salinisphaera sp. Q1T1-3]RJS94100.1 hypothetical protein D3260_05915 [Salinisphaera sp. Q1T1-3]
MLRFFFWAGLLVVIGLVVRERYRRVRRRLRGEPEPQQQGPRTVTLVLIAIGVVYGLLIGYRLLTMGPNGLFS